MVGVLVFPSLPWDTYVETSLLVRTTNNEQRLHLLDVFFFQQSTTSITNYIVYCSQMPPPNMIIPPPTIIHTYILSHESSRHDSSSRSHILCFHLCHETTKALLRRVDWFKVLSERSCLLVNYRLLVVIRQQSTQAMLDGAIVKIVRDCPRCSFPHPTFITYLVLKIIPVETSSPFMRFADSTTSPTSSRLQTTNNRIAFRILFFYA